MCPIRLLTREPSVSCIINNYTDIINNLNEYCTNGMASGKSTGLLANMKSLLFIMNDSNLVRGNPVRGNFVRLI